MIVMFALALVSQETEEFQRSESAIAEIAVNLTDAVIAAIESSESSD